MWFLVLLSQAMGYVSTFVWSLSFYFMIWEVVKVKNADGLSINYLAMNYVGYAFYSIYNLYGYVYNPSYNNGQIHISDLLFAFHGYFIVMVQIILVIYYPRETNQPELLWMSFAISCFLCAILYGLILNPHAEAIVKLMGLMKVIISFVKYSPQVYLNYTRKSTKGWSIQNTILDCTGGGLAFLQIFVDYYNRGTSDPFFAKINFSKFLLGIVSVAFDVIFMIQHFVLYKGRSNIINTNVYEIEESLIADKPHPRSVNKGSVENGEYPTDP